MERMTVNRLFNTLFTRSEAYQRHNQSISNQAMNERVTSQSDSSRGSQISHPPQQPRRGGSVSDSSTDGGEEPLLRRWMIVWDSSTSCESNTSLAVTARSELLGWPAWRHLSPDTAKHDVHVCSQVFILWQKKVFGELLEGWWGGGGRFGLSPNRWIAETIHTMFIVKRSERA